jgi:hypothetical protein
MKLDNVNEAREGLFYLTLSGKRGLCFVELASDD